jgi:hypothetical protein
MDRISIGCPNCGKRLKAPSTVVGKSVKCPACSRQFVAQAASPAREEPGMVRCEVCSAEIVEAAADRIGGKLCCPQCFVRLEAELGPSPDVLSAMPHEPGEDFEAAGGSGPLFWLSVLWDLAMVGISIGMAVYSYQAWQRLIPGNPMVRDMTAFPIALSICVPMMWSMSTQVYWWKRLILAASLAFSLLAVLTYVALKPYWILSDWIPGILAGAVLCLVPIIFGRGLAKIILDLFNPEIRRKRAEARRKSPLFSARNIKIGAIVMGGLLSLGALAGGVMYFRAEGRRSERERIQREKDRLNEAYRKSARKWNSLMSQRSEVREALKKAGRRLDYHTAKLSGAKTPERKAEQKKAIESFKKRAESLKKKLRLLKPLIAVEEALIRGYKHEYRQLPQAPSGR